MKIVLAALPCLMFAASAAIAAPTEQPGTYKEAVLCSGLLSATSVFLTDAAQNGGDADTKEQIDYVNGLQSRWVGQAIKLAPDASKVMDDVTGQSKHFAALFGQLKDSKEADINAVLGDDLGVCLDSGAKLPQ